MHKRFAGRAAVASMFVIVLGILWAMPALAAHEGDDHGKGDGSERTMTIEVECDSVEVTSSKRISEVTVHFADGTSEEIDPNKPDDDPSEDSDDDGDEASDDDSDEGSDGSDDDSDEGSDHEFEFSETFEDTVDRAIARSGRTEVEDAAEDCDSESGADNGDSPDATAGDEPSGDGSSGGTRDTTTPPSRSPRTGTTSSGETADPSTGTGAGATTTAAGTTSAGGGLDGGSVGGSGFGFSGGSAHVLASLAVANGAKVCPSGPYKGMPYINIKDCGDEVLAALLARTGAPDMTLLVALGTALIGAGVGLLRLRRSRSQP